MQIVFSPIRSDAPATYTFAGETVTVVHDGQSEVYDFTSLPDGEAESIGQGALPIPCVKKAARVDGQLTVTLLLTHGKDAPEAVRFPANPMTIEQAEALLAQAYGGA